MTFSAGHALIVGVSRYRFARQADVPVALDDAQAVSQVLRDPAVCGYPPEQVRMVTDVSATRDGILNALDELAQRAGVDDTVFLFYCGHGAYGTDENFYLVSHDAHLRGERVIAGTGVSETELLLKLKNLESKRILLVFNTCYSGKLSPALDVDPASFESKSLPQNSSAALLGTGSGRIVITASGESQKSYIGAGNLSIFAQALVDGLRGEGVRNQSGYISAFDLYEHIYHHVSRTAKELIQQTQEPELTVMKGVGPFAVALYQGSQEQGEYAPDRSPPGRTKAHTVQPEQARRLFELKVVDTGGGAYIHGNVDTGGGSFVGRDQTIQGDAVHGDSITTGDISGSTVAVGRGASAEGAALVNDQDIERYRLKLFQLARSAPAEVRQQVVDQIDKLVDEIKKGGNADDSRLATIVSDLVDNLPQSAGTISQLFSDRGIAWIAGDVTHFVLKKIG